MSDPRAFKIKTPHMTGSDVQAWQALMAERFAKWNIDYPVLVDGDYGQATRAATASFLRAWGAKSAEDLMAEGVTPELRTRVRHDRRTTAEAILFEDPSRQKYRAALRERYAGGGVSMPLVKILADSWGYHRGVHDGIDLICPPRALLFAMCKAEVVRADRGGWWGNNPSGDVSKGDGIIVLRSLVDAGPIKQGMNLCYGHAEHPVVSVGQHVQPGEIIGSAGLAVAWHVHLMVNMRGDAKGVGDRDPLPVYDYVRRNA